MNLHLNEIAQAVAPGAHALVLVDQGWLASVAPAGDPGQHHPCAAPGQGAGVEPGREHLAIHARELALEPRAHASILFIPTIGLQATLRSPFSRGEAGSGSRNLSEIGPGIGSLAFMREPCSRTGSSPPTLTSPTTAATLGTSSRTSPGSLCPSDCVTGLTGSD